jgi:hypothetical protein
MTGELESVVERLAEHHRGRHFGKYRGLVRDVADPDGMARIRAEVPAVYGEAVSPWAMPALPFAGRSHGLVLLPEAGDGVWIEFEGGDLARPIWSGCWFAKKQRPKPDGAKVRLLSTTAGHQVLIDEDADEMKLVHPGGAELVLGADEITLSLGGCSIRISATEVSINDGMVKVTAAGASLVNDAFKVGG